MVLNNFPAATNPDEVYMIKNNIIKIAQISLNPFFVSPNRFDK